MRRWGGWTGRDSGQTRLWSSGARGGGAGWGECPRAASTGCLLSHCHFHLPGPLQMALRSKITRHHCGQQKSDNTRDGRCRTPRGSGSAIRGEGSRALGLNHPFPPLWIGGGSAPPLTPSWSGRINGEGEWAGQWQQGPAKVSTLTRPAHLGVTVQRAGDPHMWSSKTSGPRPALSPDLGSPTPSAPHPLQTPAWPSPQPGHVGLSPLPDAESAAAGLAPPAEPCSRGPR